MQKLFIFIAALIVTVNIQAVTITELVKVNAGNNPKCVEYYNYQGELYCTTTAKSAKPMDANIKSYERLNIVFDERPWQLAWGNKTPTLTTVEYVPKGDDIDHWNELITSQFFPGLQKKFSLLHFANMMIHNLKESGFKPIVKFIEATPDRVIFEFRIETPPNQIQDEMQMLIKDNKGIYVLHYVIKKADMGDENRAKWVKNLKSSTIKK